MNFMYQKFVYMKFCLYVPNVTFDRLQIFFFRFQTTNVAYFQRKIQLSGRLAIPINPDKELHCTNNSVINTIILHCNTNSCPKNCKNSITCVDKKNQLDVTFCILYFSSNSCSTCFGQPCAHHQELTTA